MASILSQITAIVRDLLIFVAVMTALLVALLVIVARMPSDNPLKRILVALSYRMGATAAAGALAIPIEPIPGLDGLYDVGMPILLFIYWLSMFREVKRFKTRPREQPPAPRIGRRS